ncbi:MAG: efflux RND transporter periplasmic adaptor subunit [Beijerinckiaceae bacterium]|jgi:HlyD family secretion protein
MTKRTRNVLIVVAVLLALGGFAAYKFAASIRDWINPSRGPGFLLVSGNIEAHESVLSFKTVQSRIIELPFDEGQWVTVGTLIARVESEDYCQQVVIAQTALETQRRQLDVARQNVEAAKKTVVSDEADLQMKQLDYDRALRLLTTGAGTVETRDQTLTAFRQSTAALDRDKALESASERNVALAEANIRNAEASLNMAKIVLGYTTLTAPFDGVILVRQAELGEVSLPGAPVVTLADLDHVWLRAYINEQDIGKVRYGATAIVMTDTYPGKKYQGRISVIASNAEFTPKSVESYAERVTLVYRIRIDIYNPTHELVPGMPADAHIQLLPPGPS